MSHNIIRVIAGNSLKNWLCLMVFIILSLVATTLVSQASDAKEFRKIVAAIPADFPPTYYRDAITGKPTGFAIDVMNEVARRTGLEVEYVFGQPWAEILDMLESGKADVVPNLTIEESRKKRFAFTKPVETMQISYIVRKQQHVTGPFPGMRVGVMSGSVAHTFLASRKDIIVVSYEGLQQLLFDLLAGQIDMLLTAAPNIMKMAFDVGVEDRIKVLQPPVMEGLRGMALRQADAELRQRLDNVIDEFVGSDSYRDIYARWWGKPKPFWNTTKLIALMVFLVGGVMIVMAIWRFRSIARLNLGLLKACELADRERMKSNSILESVNDGLSIQDRDLRVLYQNASHTKMMGAHLGEYCYQAYRNRDSACDNCLVLETFRTEAPAMATTFATTLAGTRHLEIHASPIRDERGKVVSVIESVRDVTARHEAEELRHKDLIFIETLMQNSPMGLRVFDAETADCVMVNQAAADIAGGDVATMQQQNFRNLASWQETGLLATAESVIADGSSRVFETLMCTSFGKQVTVTNFVSRFVVNENTYLLVMGRDVTEERRLEEESAKIEKQLLHSQKLESLGILAGGIAHDFNNILTTIIGNTELALLRLNPESPVLENLHRIEKSAARATDLAKQMLAYSGKGKFVVEAIDLNRLIEEMVHMLEVSISKKAVLRFNFTRPLPSVEADATQLRQVIMNLVINASEAIGDKSGVIVITTGCMDCDQKYMKDVWLCENITDGLYVHLEISDTGCGMSKETLAKLFDPFFTTKFTGRGLGMAAVQGIVRGHKGAIKVYSEPGKGTSFKILLPASDKPAEIFNGESCADTWKGSGTVLLADDEETVRAIGRELLLELGYEVITAGDGQAALDIFRSRDNIDIVILDLTMPHLDGEQTFRELRTLNPNIKVIISSGYSELEVTEKFAGKGLAGFIQKPYKMSTLRDVMRNLA